MRALHSEGGKSYKRLSFSCSEHRYVTSSWLHFGEKNRNLHHQQQHTLTAETQNRSSISKCEGLCSIFIYRSILIQQSSCRASPDITTDQNTIQIHSQSCLSLLEPSLSPWPALFDLIYCWSEHPPTLSCLRPSQTNPHYSHQHGISFQFQTYQDVAVTPAITAITAITAIFVVRTFGIFFFTFSNWSRSRDTILITTEDWIVVWSHFWACECGYECQIWVKPWVCLTSRKGCTEKKNCELHPAWIQGIIDWSMGWLMKESLRVVAVDLFFKSMRRIILSVRFKQWLLVIQFRGQGDCVDSFVLWEEVKSHANSPKLYQHIWSHVGQHNFEVEMPPGRDAKDTVTMSSDCAQWCKLQTVTSGNGRQSLLLFDFDSSFHNSLQHQSSSFNQNKSHHTKSNNNLNHECHNFGRWPCLNHWYALTCSSIHNWQFRCPVLSNHELKQRCSSKRWQCCPSHPTSKEMSTRVLNLQEKQRLLQLLVLW